MNRREALARTGALFGATIIGGQVFLSGCGPNENPLEELDERAVSLMDEIGETILPSTTSSPGAKAARIGAFMKTIVTDCYSKEERTAFLEGLRTIQKTASDKFDQSFMDLSAADKYNLIEQFDKEAKNQKENSPAHFFTMLNQLTVWGYFSSEPGATKALRYVPIPGRYDGCIDYKEGEGAWVY
jgi:hypothetical protein